MSGRFYGNGHSKQTTPCTVRRSNFKSRLKNRKPVGLAGKLLHSDTNRLRAPRICRSRVESQRNNGTNLLLAVAPMFFNSLRDEVTRWPGSALPLPRHRA